MTGQDLARAAQGFVGCPFRLHGRDPATGLDCVGLIEASFAAIGRTGRMPNGYSLRTARWHGLDELAAGWGLAPAGDGERAGDIVLLRPSALQMHFAIAGLAAGTRIEAHAGLRCVVIGIDPGSCSLIRRWRMV